jgi:hypothetical protein
MKNYKDKTGKKDKIDKGYMTDILEPKYKKKIDTINKSDKTDKMEKTDKVDNTDKADNTTKQPQETRLT